jgi:nitroimidazol reductase NimA-like FMN-containing flavoprotein (pyridoxamine 5'-phosphate oxidase superfamily)
LKERVGTSRRGTMTRSDRQLSDGDARAFLRTHVIASVGTSDTAGWPYVVPLMYVYEEGDRLFLHTGARGGHFISNIRENPKICITVSEPGPLQQGSPSPCNSALVYKSAVVFGTVRIYEAPDVNQRKSWFFDQLLDRLGDSREKYSAGYTMLDHIILYEVAIEVLTGKVNVGLHH